MIPTAEERAAALVAEAEATHGVVCECGVGEAAIAAAIRAAEVRAREEEREACAAVAEGMSHGCYMGNGVWHSDTIAGAIRARSNS